MRWYRIRPIVRIAVFIDGGYFAEVSRYYKFRHPRGLRLSFAGLHTLIRGLTAEFEGVDRMQCQVVESH